MWTIILMIFLGLGAMLHVRSVFTIPKETTFKNPMDGSELFVLLMLIAIPVVVMVQTILLVKTTIVLFGGVIFIAYHSFYSAAIYLHKRQKAIDENNGLYVPKFNLLDKSCDLVGAIFLCYLLYLLGLTIL